MGPPPFEYVCPTTLDDALAALQYPDAVIIAGGQSLVPRLNRRLLHPRRVVDVSRLDELRGLAPGAAAVELGALVTHTQLLADAHLHSLPLLAMAAGSIGFRAVRTRGTLGGSLALAHPAAELPAAMVAMDARFRLRGPLGERWVAAADFFVGRFETILAEGEIVISAEVPRRPQAELASLLEFRRSAGDYAAAGLAMVGLAVDGHLADLSIAWFGVSERPIRAAELCEDLEGCALEDKVQIERACLKAARGLDSVSDLRGSAEYRRHLIARLTYKAVAGLSSTASQSLDDQPTGR